MIDDLAKIDKTASAESRVREFCAKERNLEYDDFIGVLRDGSASHLSLNDDSIHSTGVSMSGDIPGDILDDVETIIGKKLRERPSYFSCGC